MRRDTWVPPYKRFCRAGPACPAGSAGKESPSHGFAVPAPLRQGGRGDGGDGLPRALRALAMTHYKKCDTNPAGALASQ